MIGRVQLDPDAEGRRNCLSNLVDDFENNTGSPFSVTTIVVLTNVALRICCRILVKLWFHGWYNGVAYS